MALRVRRIEDLPAALQRQLAAGDGVRDRGGAGSGSRPRSAHRRRGKALPERNPQAMLWEAVRVRFAERGPQAEYRALPHRRYRIDMAFPQELLAVEVEGYAFHGRTLATFHRDRQREQQLVCAGWRVLRFPAGQIHRDLPGVLNVIEQALTPGHR